MAQKGSEIGLKSEIEDGVQRKRPYRTMTFMAKISPVNAHAYEIGSFLGNRTLRIPELQRPYSWERDQAVELIEDLKKVAGDAPEGNKPQHFFGTIVLLTNGLDDRSHIIDGQQRLTTTTLVLGLIEQSIIRVGKRTKTGPAAAGIADEVDRLSRKVHELLWYSGALNAAGKSERFPRILVSPEIRETYENLLRGEVPKLPAGMGAEKTPAKNLMTIAKWVQDNYVEPPSFKGMEPVAQLQHLERCRENITNRLLVVCLSTESANAGYDLFECLNDRGVPLDALDLLKVWMLSEMAGPNEEKVAASMRALSSGDKVRQLAFFTDYFRTQVRRNPKQARNSAKRLVNDARKDLFKDPSMEEHPFQRQDSIQDRIEKELSHMEKLSPIWIDVKDGKVPSSIKVAGQPQITDRDWAVFRMRLLTTDLKHTGLNFALFTVAAEFASEQVADFSRFVHLIDRFFFRFKVICRGAVGDLENAYFDLMKRFQESKSLDLEYSKTRLQELIDTKANDHSFEIQMSDRLSYSTTAQPRIRYFLQTLDSYKRPNAPLKQPVALDAWNLEHIYPQNPVGGSKIDLALTHDIGNLVLLDVDLNIEFSNGEFSEKKKIAKSKESTHQISLVDARKIFYGEEFSSWGPDEIAQRRTQLFEEAKNVFKLSPS